MERVCVLKIDSFISEKKIRHRKVCLRAAVKPCWCQSVCRSDTWFSHLASWGWDPLPQLCLHPWRGDEELQHLPLDILGWIYSRVCLHSGCDFSKESRSNSREKGVKEELLSDRIVLLPNLHCLITLLELLNVLRWMQRSQWRHFSKWSATKMTNRG